MCQWGIIRGKQLGADSFLVYAVLFLEEVSRISVLGLGGHFGLCEFLFGKIVFLG